MCYYYTCKYATIICTCASIICTYATIICTCATIIHVNMLLLYVHVQWFSVLATMAMLPASTWVRVPPKIS